MRRPRRTLLHIATVLSCVLLALTTACWVTGLLRERNATVWRIHSRPGRTFFARIDRQHLIVSDHQLAGVRMPPGYKLDTSGFGQFRVGGPSLPRGASVDLDPQGQILSPDGAGFRTFRTDAGDIGYMNTGTGERWQAAGSYGAAEIPWWSLLLLFSLLPALRWVARRRRRSKARRGLYPECGYDLRATPGRCPECGAGVEPLAAHPS